MKTLPASPDLSHLKKQAKDLLREAHAGDPAALTRFVASLPAVHGLSLHALATRELRLHDAQSVVAREHGFRSWAELKGYVEWKAVDRATRLATWLTWAYDGNPRQRRLAVRMLREEPAFFSGDARLACALGDEAGVRLVLERDAAWVHRSSGDPMPMPPLVAVTHSLLMLEPGFADGLMACARLLLAAGADVNGFRVLPDCRLSALYGAAGKTHHPGMTKLLLEAGANPDDNESLYHSVEARDSACTQLLLAAGAQVSGTNALGHVLDYEKLDDLRSMLAHGGDINERPWVHHAILRGRSIGTIQVLLASGADPHRKNAHGISLFRYAQIHGRSDVAALLQAAGAGEPLSEVEQFLAACARGDEEAAKAFGPQMLAQLNGEALSLLPQMAAVGNLAAVRTMAALGWPLEVKTGWDATALNMAVFIGHPALTELLLHAGANWQTVHGYRDTVIGTLSWASQSGQAESPGDYVGCASALLAGGVPLAAFADYSFSREVAEVLDRARLSTAWPRAARPSGIAV